MKGNIIKYALATEKSIRGLETQNSLGFVVDRKATKQEIKKELEEEFDVKVKTVRTLITNTGIKKAYVQFSEETLAIDLATKLGIM